MSQQTPWSSASYNLQAPLLLKPYMPGCFVDLSIGSGLCNPALWLVVVFCCSFCCKQVSLMRGEVYTHLGIKGQIFSQPFCWFSKVVVLSKELMSFVACLRLLLTSWSFGFASQLGEIKIALIIRQNLFRLDFGHWLPKRKEKMANPFSDLWF